MSFESLGLSEPILRAAIAEGYAAPTPIQSKSIPLVIAGRDLLGCAQTGTGKTAAFAMPMLHRLAGRGPDGGSARAVRALVLCPTRELASQIGESLATYGRHLKLKHTVIFGGVNQFHQVRALKAGVDILVATPGRLMDLMNQGHVRLNGVQMLVLDEADRMLDMGFIHDIRRIIKHVPTDRQTLLFSATMPSEIRGLAESILRNPAKVEVNPVSSTAVSIQQSVHHVSRQDKPALLAHVLRQAAPCRALVFTRTKHGADKVVKLLVRSGIRAEAIHGNKSQNARTRALSNFKSAQPPVLVATDIASRGIDVDGVTHVINFDIPHEPEAYVHRIGRTARAGATGVAISFCDHEERGDFRAIERLTQAAIAVQPRVSVPALVFNEHAARDGKKAGGPRHAPPRAPDSDRKRHAKPRSRRDGQPGEKQKAAAHAPSRRHGVQSSPAPSSTASATKSFGQRGRGRGRPRRV